MFNKRRITSMSFLILCSIMVLGCASLEPPPNTLSIYMDKPPSGAVPGSRYQATGTNIYDFTFDEVFDAASQAILRTGYNVERKDRDKGIISGGGTIKTFYHAGTYYSAFTFAVYVEEIDTNPTTRTVTVVDVHSSSIRWPTWDEEALEVKSKIIAEMQKVLATY